MSWTTSDRITALVEKRWLRGDILAARVTGEALFPLRLRLRRPGPRDVTDRFGEVMDWARALERASRDVRGFGYIIEQKEVRSRVHGTNQLPVAAIVPTEADALRLIRRSGAADRFQTLVDCSVIRHPMLRDWLARRPLQAMEQAEHWREVLAVLDWFTAHPRPGLYPRQLDIPGVDTKFIESHRSLLSELLDLVLPESAIDRAAAGARAFNARYGLRDEPPLVRFRLLDPSLFVHGLSDLSLPPDQFALLDLPVRRVFITENRVNGLAFPACSTALVVFGLGYGLERLAEVPWLHRADVLYWGDIDTHGFGILHRLRAVLPHARSFLMDRVTLEAHRALCVQEPAGAQYTGDVSRLTSEECELYRDLLEGRLGERVRLEQERVVYGWVEAALRVLQQIPDEGG